MDDVKPAVAQMAECLADWYKLAQTVYLKTQILEEDVRDAERKLHGIRDDLYMAKSQLKTDVDAKVHKQNNQQLSKIEHNNRLRGSKREIIWFIKNFKNTKLHLLAVFATAAKGGHGYYAGKRQTNNNAGRPGHKF